MTLSTQSLQIIVGIRAAVGQRLDVIQFSRNGSSAHGAHGVSAEYPGSQRLQRSPSYSLRPVCIHHS